MRNDFAVFICTHGRPNNQLTLNLLRNCGYTGKIYLVLDNGDDTIQQYLDRYGAQNIIIFDKEYVISQCDAGKTNPPIKVILYAKWAIERIAKDLGLSNYVIADDDIKEFRFRYPEDGHLKGVHINSNLDAIVDAIIDYQNLTKFPLISFGSAPSYIGGTDCFEPNTISRNCTPYNFIFRCSSVDVNWTGAILEDIVTPLQYNRRGNLCTMIIYVQQSLSEFLCGKGGMAETYSTVDGFEQACYALLYSPDVVKIGVRKNRYTPFISRRNCGPKIISSDFRKEN